MADVAESDEAVVVVKDELGGAGDGEEPDWCFGKQPVDDGLVSFTEVLPTVKTGDLVQLYSRGNPHPHYGILVNFPNSDPDLPLLLIKGRTKPLDRGTFISHRVRHLHINVAAVRLFYGDYEKVAIKRLMKGAESHHEKNVLSVVEEVEQTPLSPEEIKAIEEADSPEQRSAVLCAFNLARIFHELGALSTDNPSCVRPDTLEEFLSLQEPDFIKLPPPKPGPLAHEHPFLFNKLSLVCLSVCVCVCLSKLEKKSSSIYPIVHEMSPKAL